MKIHQLILRNSLLKISFLFLLVGLAGVSCIDKPETASMDSGDLTQTTCSALCNTIQQCEFTQGFFIDSAESTSDFTRNLTMNLGTYISSKNSDECMEVCSASYTALDTLEVSSSQCSQIEKKLNTCYASLSCEQLYLGNTDQTECQSLREQHDQASCEDLYVATLESELPKLKSLTSDQVLCPSMNGSLDELQLSIAPSINSLSPQILKPSAVFKLEGDGETTLQYLEETLMTQPLNDLVQFMLPTQASSELMSVA